jgi:hypothetical protein
MSKPIEKPIESLYPLDLLFPQHAFKIEHPLTLHHLIVKGHPKIVEWIDKNKREQWFRSYSREGIFLWDFPEPQRKYTPLHLCAIKGNAVAMAELIKVGADPKAMDVKGWTPADHALVCGRQNILDLLQSKGLLNISQGAYPTLSRLLSHSVPKPEDIVFDYLDSSDGQVKQGSAELFKKLTGAHFTMHFFATPERLIKDHRTSVLKYEAHEGVKATLAHYRKKYLENPSLPKMYLAHSDDRLGVRAQGDIEACSILFAYVGEQQLQRNPLSVHAFGKTDGTDYSNVGPLCRDAFPNACPMPILDVHGLNEITIFVSGEAIPKDQEITYHYGYGHFQVKRGLHVELKKKEMEEFFTQHPVKELFKTLREQEKQIDSVRWDNASENDIQTLVPLLLSKDRLKYVFHTYSSLAYLMLKGIISNAEIEELLNDPAFCQLIEADPIYEREMGNDINIMKQIMAKLADMQSVNPEEASQMQEFVQLLIESVSPRACSDTLYQLLSMDFSEWCPSKETLWKEAQVIHEIDQILFRITDQNDGASFGRIRELLKTLPELIAKGVYLGCYQFAVDHRLDLTLNLSQD